MGLSLLMTCFSLGIPTVDGAVSTDDVLQSRYTHSGLGCLYWWRASVSVYPQWMGLSLLMTCFSLCIPTVDGAVSTDDRLQSLYTHGGWGCLYWWQASVSVYPRWMGLSLLMTGFSLCIPTVDWAVSTDDVLQSLYTHSGWGCLYWWRASVSVYPQWVGLSLLMTCFSLRIPTVDGAVSTDDRLQSLYTHSGLGCLYWWRASVSVYPQWMGLSLLMTCFNLCIPTVDGAVSTDDVLQSLYTHGGWGCLYWWRASVSVYPQWMGLSLLMTCFSLCIPTVDGAVSTDDVLQSLYTHSGWGCLYWWQASVSVYPQWMGLSLLMTGFSLCIPTVDGAVSTDDRLQSPYTHSGWGCLYWWRASVSVYPQWMGLSLMMTCFSLCIPTVDGAVSTDDVLQSLYTHSGWGCLYWWRASVSVYPQWMGLSLLMTWFNLHTPTVDGAVSTDDLLQSRYTHSGWGCLYWWHASGLGIPTVDGAVSTDDVLQSPYTPSGWGCLYWWRASVSVHPRWMGLSLLMTCFSLRIPTVDGAVSTDDMVQSLYTHSVWGCLLMTCFSLRIPTVDGAVSTDDRLQSLYTHSGWGCLYWWRASISVYPRWMGLSLLMTCFSLCIPTVDGAVSTDDVLQSLYTHSGWGCLYWWRASVSVYPRWMGLSLLMTCFNLRIPSVDGAVSTDDVLQSPYTHGGWGCLYWWQASVSVYPQWMGLSLLMTGFNLCIPTVDGAVSTDDVLQSPYTHSGWSCLYWWQASISVYPQWMGLSLLMTCFNLCIPTVDGAVSTDDVLQSLYTHGGWGCLYWWRASVSVYPQWMGLSLLMTCFSLRIPTVDGAVSTDDVLQSPYTHGGWGCLYWWQASVSVYPQWMGLSLLMTGFSLYTETEARHPYTHSGWGCLYLMTCFSLCVPTVDGAVSTDDVLQSPYTHSGWGCLYWWQASVSVYPQWMGLSLPMTGFSLCAPTVDGAVSTDDVIQSPYTHSGWGCLYWWRASISVYPQWMGLSLLMTCFSLRIPTVDGAVSTDDVIQSLYTHSGWGCLYWWRDSVSVYPQWMGLSLPMTGFSLCAPTVDGAVSTDDVI